jgi:hypothetical protein
MKSSQKTVFETNIDYGPAEEGSILDFGGACTLYVDDSAGEEWAVRFNLCTPLDCLIADTHDAEGFADEEDRSVFDAMKLDLQLMLARIERVKFR